MSEGSLASQRARRSIPLRAVGACAFALLAACSSPDGPASSPPIEVDDGRDYVPGVAWREAPPAAVGLDAGILSGVVSRMRSGQIRNLHSLLVVKNGYLAVEEYFGSSSAADVHTLQSVTKSVTSLLVGIAIDEGKIAGATEPLLGFFPEYASLQHVDARKSAIALRDVLTMRTGLDWAEYDYSVSPLRQLNESSGDWVRLVLDWPMREPPGTRFEYNSGGVIAIAGAVRNATGEPFDAFAHRTLFEPLGITGERWYRSPFDGLPHTGGGLLLRATDMARIGYLVLRNGRWGTRQVVSEQWIRASTARSVIAPRTFGSHPVDYGYLWWLMPLNGSAGDADLIITASGALSQWIFIIPKHDMVVVVTGNAEAGSDWVRPVDVLYADVLLAVR